MKKIFITASIVSTLFIAKSQNRIVLLEKFTNAGCPSCGVSSPSFYTFVNNSLTDVVAVAYHTSWPYQDSMYLENPTEVNSRVNFYNIVSVPTTIMDGNVFNGNTGTFNSQNTTLVNNRKVVSPKYNIHNNGLTLSNNQLNGSFHFTSLVNNQMDNLTAHIIVIEKNVLKSSYASFPSSNGETQFGYVFRKMLPNSSGTVLMNKTLNGVDMVNFNWTLSKIKNTNELRVVAFIQNNTTKEIYQSIMVSPTITTDVKDISSEDNSIVIYPNPTEGAVYFSFEKAENIDNIIITNTIGEVVKSFDIKGNSTHVELNEQLAKGIYVVNFMSNKNLLTHKKLVVQ